VLYLVFYLLWTPLFYLAFEKWNIAFMPTPNETLMKQPLYEQILQAVILGPLIETLICQKLVYKLLSLIKYLKRRKFFIMLIGALIFGLLHFYSLLYIIYNVFTGFLFMYAYIVKLHKKPYWTVVTLHGLMNLFAIFMDPIETIVFSGM
jgi:membrane protease YdiL (CAAX protease family)